MRKTLLLFMSLWGTLMAQMPSECLLIVNGRSLQAMLVSNVYADLRNFPAERILVLNPDISFFRQENGTPRWTVNEEDARKVLLEPILKKIAELNDPSPTALILSPEWPTRIKVAHSPEVSITGFLSSGGELPAGDKVKGGKAISPWFVSPPDTPQRANLLLRYPTQRKLTSMYYPASMLSVYYPPLTTEKMLDHLNRSVKSDYGQPGGSIVFETSNDVRTQTRLRQFYLAKRRLEEKEFEVELISASAKPPSNVRGVMAGAASVNTRRYDGRLVPGSFAEHLTSFAANFDAPGQTKLSQWLDAGAAASAGTVTEPYTIWMKFPEAAFFERYLRGNTLLEALMQSIASPYQSLIVGDTLCRPWAKELQDLNVETKWNGNILTVEAKGVPKGFSTTTHLFVDGVQVHGDGGVWTLEVNEEEFGPELELILHARYLWAPPETGSLRKRIKTPMADSLQLRGDEKRTFVSLDLKSRNDELVFVEIYRRNNVISSKSLSGTRANIQLGFYESGTGPVSLRARAVTQKGQILWSPYVDLHPEPPQL